ncbi:hypothetical protein GGR52DRAFT_528067 [Hypoxylon sp. FL1284]|nr:hypothetical protein GGR52DRAFT_528067 [Hypoxylon sp. FL1284]
MKNGLLRALGAASTLAASATAARICGANMNNTYQWTLGDARYDDQVNGTATVAFSIMPGDGTGYATFYECVSAWPEPWQGWYDGKVSAGPAPATDIGNLIWGDCIWSGNGPNYDTTVAFAMDWSNRTMHLAHAYVCGDQEGSEGVAIGHAALDLACETDEEGAESCILNTESTAKAHVSTVGSPAHVASAPDTACADADARYQVWQVDAWTRQYALAPGATTPSADSGPSFTLSNLPGTQVFQCAPGADSPSSGQCEYQGDDETVAAASFEFDPDLDLLKLTQTWNCGCAESPECKAPSYLDVTAVGFVQATCNRAGDMLNCATGPVMIGEASRQKRTI